MDRSQRKSQRMAWLVVGVWAIACCVAFWHFELRNLRPFVPSVATTFDPVTRAQDAEHWLKSSVGLTWLDSSGAAATVVNVYRQDCPCNRFTDSHLSNIAAHYQSRRVRFASVAAEQAPDWIDATPAALVFDANGRLLYFGPYSDAARCGSAGGFVEKVLDRTLAGIPARLQPILAGGCFCGRPRLSA